MNVDQNQTPVQYVKAKQGQGLPRKKTGTFKTIAILLGLLVFIGGAVSVFLISQKQDTTPVAPTAPQSQPAAYVEQTKTCTLEFDVVAPDKIACGYSGCTLDSDCGSELVCVSADDGLKYCAKEAYQSACADDPGAETCCSAPILLACGEGGCSTTDDCEDDFVCISTSTIDNDGNIVKYCANEDYLDDCVADPNKNNCCAAPTPTGTETPTPTGTETPTPTGTRTPTPTVTPVATTTPIVIYATATPTVTYTSTTIVTTADCNESCSANADCKNTSHICYNGLCRLDVNPTDDQCKLANGETTIVRPITVPTQSGPASWANYIKAGIGTLGIGALLLLLL